VISTAQRRASIANMAKKIVMLLGHPDNVGLNNELAAAYEKAARDAGHDVIRFNIGEMRFDPVLHKGYRAVQELEPDLMRFQDAVMACDHFVIFHPIWWVGMPAVLKGLFDRCWLPGSTFRYIRMQSGRRTIFWHRLMRGKTARLVVTSGTQPLLVRFLPGNVNAQLKWGILWFAGFRVRTLWLGPSENVPQARKARWIRKVAALGAAAK
jgi:NAD(P)H dehydrogenase (quinone)